jgi:cytochrome c oxidase assembly protein subunit 15
MPPKKNLQIPLLRPTTAIGWWLIISCLMVYGAILIGGLTRLTDSGLSIVEWQPISGIFPPLTIDAWQKTFRAYQAIPEFQLIYPQMTLEEFKGIFWWEYIHRLWGRLIGLVFIIPFLFFWLRHKLSFYLKTGGIGISLLIMGQGLMGWLMVKSGLDSRTDVNHFRLAAHLSLALLIYSWLLWLAFKVFSQKLRNSSLTKVALASTDQQPIYLLGIIGLLLVSMTIISGSLVAGLDGGLIYNTFPLMGGRVLPEEFLQNWSFWYVLLEEPAGVQFLHRAIVFLSFGFSIFYWIKFHRHSDNNIRRATHMGLLAMIIQICIGVTTLLMVAPLPLALLHQTGAVVVLSSWVWILYTLQNYNLSLKLNQSMAATCSGQRKNVPPGNG